MLKWWTKKKTTVPESNRTIEVECVQLWGVRWTSRSGTFSAETRPEMEAFPTEPEALAFKESLDNAFKLLRITGAGTSVTVERMK